MLNTVLTAGEEDVRGKRKIPAALRGIRSKKKTQPGNTEKVKTFRCHRLPRMLLSTGNATADGDALTTQCLEYMEKGTKGAEE